MRRVRSLKPLLPLMGIALALVVMGGCGKDAEPTVEPTAEPVAQWPTLEVLEPVVQYRAREEQPLEEVTDGASVGDVEAGANVVTGDGGLAVLEWPSFLSAELAPGTDMLLGLSMPSQRQVVIDQATGTVRYDLQGPGEPASLEIMAGWTTIRVEAGAAAFVVSLVPGDTPVAWVAVSEGRVAFSRGDDGAETIEVSGGQAAGMTEDGPMPVALDVDKSAVQAWYDLFKAGRADAAIGAVALRCQAEEDLDLRTEPGEGSEPVGDPIPAGSIVVVDGRTEDALWLWVRAVTAREGGWVPAGEDLRCTGPASAAPVTEVEAEEPTATPPPPTRAVIYVTATPLLVASPTVSATPTGTGEYSIKFWADRETIEEGECTVLRWDTNNINSVYYDGDGVVGNGSSQECPTRDTTYELKVILRDGTTQTRTITIKVKLRAKTVEPTDQPLPTAVPPTAGPPTAEPPTAEPPAETPPQP